MPQSNGRLARAQRLKVRIQNEIRAKLELFVALHSKPIGIAFAPHQVVLAILVNHAHAVFALTRHAMKAEVVWKALVALRAGETRRALVALDSHSSEWTRLEIEIGIRKKRQAKEGKIGVIPQAKELRDIILRHRTDCSLRPTRGTQTLHPSSRRA